MDRLSTIRGHNLLAQRLCAKRLLLNTIFPSVFGKILEFSGGNDKKEAKRETKRGEMWENCEEKFL